MAKEETITPEPIFVGQLLYRDASSEQYPDGIQELTVESVGKKYFYTKEAGSRYPIDKKTLFYQNKKYPQSTFLLYRDKQVILDRNERTLLINKLRVHFDFWKNNSDKNTLEQLRSAVDVLGIEMSETSN
jgi:hypothetical protein